MGPRPSAKVAWGPVLRVFLIAQSINTSRRVQTEAAKTTSPPDPAGQLQPESSSAGCSFARESPQHLPNPRSQRLANSLQDQTASRRETVPPELEILSPSQVRAPHGGSEGPPE